MLMKTLLKILSFAFLITFSSCKEEQSEDIKAFDTQRKEIIMILDDAVPKMSKINAMILRLKAEKEKLLQAEDIKTEEVGLYDKAITDLKVKAFETQMKEIIKIHDEVLPKLTTINIMISRLESEKQKVAEAEANAEEIALYDEAIADLNKSHNLMMSWMENFSNSYSRTEINQGLATRDKDSIKTKLENLEFQYRLAVEMRIAVNDAIKNAQLLLGEL